MELPGVYESKHPFHPQLDMTRGHVALFGTRGSTPTPGGPFVRHGGHTSCMALFVDDEVFIFDAGSGIRDLGTVLAKGNPRRLHLFITHTHWDHIQGFPFFQPAYLPGFEMIIYGSKSFGKDIESVFRGQLDQEYFPVQMDDMHATFDFRSLPEEPLAFGNVKISWEVVNHPGTTVGYKVEANGKRIGWIPDNEFLQGYVGPPDEIRPDSPHLGDYRKVIDFISDMDVLVHEAQYTNDEYPFKFGWGHSSVSNACALIKLGNIRRWIVTHHDPSHDDCFLEAKLSITRQILEEIDHSVFVTHGYDGLMEYL